MMPFIIRTSGYRGSYRRVAVLEVDLGIETVPMISIRAHGCRRIVQTWEKLYVGKTSRCAYREALSEAQEYAEELNRVEARNEEE